MRILTLGAGYAGLVAARRLEKRLPEDASLTIIDETAEHVVQHELHRVIRRPSFAEDITLPVDAVLERTQVLEATVTDVDPDTRTVTLADGTDVEYDYAAVCLGATTDFYGLPGVEEHATPLKRLAHARTIRERFLEVVEDGGRVVVGGAGLSGIQVAGELAALAREEGAKGTVDIVLLERLDSVAPNFPANFQAAIREELLDRDVAVRTGTAVRSATDSTVELEAGELEYDQFVWTGGIRGSTALDGERPVVRGDFQLGEGTFVIGDAARVLDRDGTPVPASAQAAVREARTAAANIARLATDDGTGAFPPRLEQYAFDAPGWIVSVGDGTVAQVGPTVFRGRTAHALKTAVGAGHLSQVGAVRQAIELAREEFGPDVTDDDVPDRPELE